MRPSSLGSFVLVSEKYLDLGRGDHEGAVDALVALEHVLREEAAGAQLGDAQCQRADAGGETALPVTVAATAQLVCLGVHHGVHFCSVSLRNSSCMTMSPSSKRGMACMSGVGSNKISAAVFVLSQNLLLW